MDMARVSLTFQSAPHFSSEANPTMEPPALGGHVVSIRASLQQRGELTTAFPAETDLAFQSAPHFSSEANFDKPVSLPSLSTFQSAPHFSSEANIKKQAFPGSLHSFNPRLTSAARRTLHRDVSP